MGAIKTIIIHPSYVVRKGFSILLAEIEELEVLKGAESIEVFKETLKTENMGIVLIDSAICEDSKIDVSKLILANRDALFIEFYHSTHGESGIVVDKLDIDATKDVITTNFLNILKKNKIALVKERNERELSEREEEIVREVALGLTNKEIAEKLFISIHTVITHRKNITQKLGIKTVSGLTVYAILNKLINPNQVQQ